MIHVFIPVRLESEANLREHWRGKSRRVREQREAVHLMLRPKLRGVTTFASWPTLLTVTITRVAPRVLDTDNLVRSAKAVRDQVAEELGIDDGSSRVAWRYAQERGKPREYAVRIRIDDAPF